MKGKLPITEFIILESGKEHWSMLINGLIKELKTSGIVKMESGVKVRVNLLISKIIPPEQKTEKHFSRTNCNMSQDVSSGLSRIQDFFVNFMGNSAWIFIGHIIGDNQQKIIINYYEKVEIFIYTQQLKTEDKKDFMPFITMN
jgi:hypothetical protein